MGKHTSQARLKQNFDSLKFLARAKPQLRNAIIGACDNSLVCCICECIKNVVEANVPVPHSTLCKLKPYRQVLDKIVNKRNNFLKKKRLIVQNGGFLPLLLPALIGVIGSLVGETVAKNVTS